MKCPYCQNENEVEVKQTEFFTGWIVKCFSCGLTSPQMKSESEAVDVWNRIQFDDKSKADNNFNYIEYDKLMIEPTASITGYIQVDWNVYYHYDQMSKGQVTITIDDVDYPEFSRFAKRFFQAKQSKPEKVQVSFLLDNISETIKKYLGNQ